MIRWKRLDLKSNVLPLYVISSSLFYAVTGCPLRNLTYDLVTLDSRGIKADIPLRHISS